MSERRTQSTTTRKDTLTLLAALLPFWGVFPTPAGAQVPGEVAALVKSHCVDCHSGAKPDAGLNLTQLKFDLADRRAFATWVRVHDKLAAGEMPPPDAEQPTPDARRGAVATLHGQLSAASLAQQKAEGRVALRRINRTQHENTLNDLLGVSIHLGDVLPIIVAGGGFKHAGHVMYDRQRNRPLSNLYVRMLHRMGVEADKFGTSTGVINDIG